MFAPGHSPAPGNPLWQSFRDQFGGLGTGPAGPMLVLVLPQRPKLTDLQTKAPAYRSHSFFSTYPP